MYEKNTSTNNLNHKDIPHPPYPGDGGGSLIGWNRKNRLSRVIFMEQDL